MRTRHKILILLLMLSLALGTMIVFYTSDNDEALRRFRLLFNNYPMELIRETVLSPDNSMGLWYGGIGLGAILIVGLVLKMGGGTQLRAFRERLVQMEVTKAELETLLQDSLWKEKHAREAKDAAVKDLEASVNRAYALQRQLGDTEKLLRSRDGEIKALRSQVSALTEQQGEMVSAMTQGQGDSLLRIELRKKTELLRANEAAVKQLEKNLTGKFHTLETQLNVKEKLLRERNKELEALKVQLSEMDAAKSRTESLLDEVRKKERQASQAKDTAIKELEKNLTGKIHDLENQFKDKDAVLQNQSREAETLREEVNRLTVRLTDVSSVKEQAEQVLQQEIKKITEVLRTKDATLKELQERSKARARALEDQVAEQEKLLTDRDAEIEALRSKVSVLAETTLARGRAENLLEEELKHELQAKDVALKDLEKRLTQRINAMETQLKEKEESLQSRSEELESLKDEVNASNRQRAELESARQRAETLLQQERKKSAAWVKSKDAAIKELEMNVSARVRALENDLKEKDAAFKARDEELGALRTQLGKMGSTKDEIEGLLRKELNKTTELLQAKDSTIKELEASLDKTVADLSNQAREQESLLKRRDAEMEGLRSEVSALKSRLTEAHAATGQSEGMLQEQSAKEEASTSQELEESATKIRALQSLLAEKDGLLESREEKIQRLESELKEKRTELARREIAIWQSIERRGLWKQRLRKIGITLKD